MSTSKDSAEEATATQRRAQATWRQWPTMLDAVVALRGDGGPDGGGCPGAPSSAPLAAVDMGCGTGEVAALLRARGWDPVVGVDGDPAMLGAAEAAHAGVRFVRHDLRGLSLAALGLERPADLVWSSFAVSFEWTRIAMYAVAHVFVGHLRDCTYLPLQRRAATT